MSLLAPPHPLTRFVCCGSSQLSLRESGGAAALEPPRLLSISVDDCIWRPHRHKPQTLRRCTEDGSEELTVPQKSRRGTPSSMVRRSSRSVMAAQWGTGKMPGGGVKVDRSCTARQRQPMLSAPSETHSAPSLSSRALHPHPHPVALSVEVQLLHFQSRPYRQHAAAMGSPRTWGFPWLARQLSSHGSASHAGRRAPCCAHGCLAAGKGLCQCALGTESGRLHISHGCTTVTAAACRLQAAALRTSLPAAGACCGPPAAHRPVGP
jgi:hypothetical protein